MFFASIVAFVVTLITVPVILIRLPEDYFSFPQRHRIEPENHNGLLRVLLIGFKNLTGLIFILLGIAMLVLPGQGLLTILIGAALLNFPGKYKLERWLISRPAVLRSINWIRTRAGKSELQNNSD